MSRLQRHLLYKQRYINAIMDANSLFEGKQIDFMQKQKQYVNTRVEKKSLVWMQKSRENISEQMATLLKSKKKKKKLLDVYL